MESKAGILIAEVKLLSDRVFERILNEHGISSLNGGQGRILYALLKKDGSSLTEIGQATGLAKTSLTSMVERMERQRLVKKSVDVNDSRITRVSLGDEGLRLLTTFVDVSKRMGDIFYEGISEDEAILFEKVLEKVACNLRKVEKDDR